MRHLPWSILLFGILYGLIQVGPRAEGPEVEITCSGKVFSQWVVNSTAGCDAALSRPPEGTTCSCSTLEHSTAWRAYYLLALPAMFAAAIFLIGNGTPRGEPVAAMDTLRYIAGLFAAPFGLAAFYGLLIVLQPWRGQLMSFSAMFLLTLIAAAWQAITVLPVLAGLWRKPRCLAAAVPVAGILGGAVLAPVLPALAFGSWTVKHTDLSHAVSLAAAFALVELVRAVIWPYRRLSLAWRSTFLAGAAAVLILAGWRNPQLTVFWSRSEHIKGYLMQQTPVGSSRAVVMAWVSEHSVRARSRTASVEARFPPVRFILETDITASYTFDDTDHLSDIQVTVMTDSS